MYFEDLANTISILKGYPQVEKISVNVKTSKVGLKLINDLGQIERHYFDFDPDNSFECSQAVLKFLEDRYDS